MAVKSRQGGWRPIVDEVEARHVQTMGGLLRQFREAAGLSRDDIAEATGLHPRHVAHLELGYRRTRRSTIEAIAEAFPAEIREDLVEELVAAAGSGLAAESPWVDRVVGRRRSRRDRKRRRAVAAAAKHQRQVVETRGTREKYSSRERRGSAPAVRANGVRVRAHRVAAGLSVVEVSELSGMPVEMIERIEDGGLASGPALERLAEAIVTGRLAGEMDVDVLDHNWWLSARSQITDQAQALVDAFVAEGLL